MNQSEFEANTWNRRQAREIVCNQDTIGFGLAWFPILVTIIERGKVKPKQTGNLLWFDTSNQ